MMFTQVNFLKVKYLKFILLVKSLSIDLAITRLKYCSALYIETTYIGTQTRIRIIHLNGHLEDSGRDICRLSIKYFIL